MDGCLMSPFQITPTQCLLWVYRYTHNNKAIKSLAPVVVGWSVAVAAGYYYSPSVHMLLLFIGVIIHKERQVVLLEAKNLKNTK